MGTGCRSPVLWRRASAARTGRRKTRELAQRLWPLLAPVGLGLVIAGGESWADPAIVSPNGLPVQVNPTFPEPGLPAFSFPQGGLSDTGGVAGAVTTGGGSGSGSGSSPTCAVWGWFSRFCARRRELDQGVGGQARRFLACSADLGYFRRAAAGSNGACTCAIRFAGRTVRFTAIGAWCAAFVSDGG